jgi:hypothetical protein
MADKEKDTATNEYPARIKRPKNPLVVRMHLVEFARFYYDGP